MCLSHNDFLPFFSTLFDFWALYFSHFGRSWTWTASRKWCWCWQVRHRLISSHRVIYVFQVVEIYFGRVSHICRVTCCVYLLPPADICEYLVLISLCQITRKMWRRTRPLRRAHTTWLNYCLLPRFESAPNFKYCLLDFVRPGLINLPAWLGFMHKYVSKRREGLLPTWKLRVLKSCSDYVQVTNWWRNDEYIAFSRS